VFDATVGRAEDCDQRAMWCDRLELLTWQECSLWDEAEEMVETFLREGTTVMKCGRSYLVEEK
jgi:hypothetical protein